MRGQSIARSVGRRRFLLGTAAFAAALGLGRGASAAPSARRLREPPDRLLSFKHLHTGETLDVVYWSEGRYQPGALADVDVILRDFRTDEIIAIDRDLLDLLHAVRRRLGTEQPFHVVSGYRSPETNAMLAAAGRGVAPNSLHMYGMAIDVRLPGIRLAQLRRAAWNLQRGGVGYYSRSNFVHLDTGRVRFW